MSFLVTGGAGYIGSHMVDLLQSLNKEVVVIDNFVTGNEWAIKDCEVIKLDLLDKDNLLKTLKKRKFECTFHFAASSISIDSFKKKSFYLKNNFEATEGLVNTLIKNDNEYMIFSSSASVYGRPLTTAIKEDHQTEPISPYGKSKLMCDKFLEKTSINTDFKSISLRYFNAAGAKNEKNIGEHHIPETHLIPSTLISVIENNAKIDLFGDNYDTIDGTCVRDYIHVQDLVAAHLKAYEYLSKTKEFTIFNLGNGKGYSNLEIIRACEKITNKNIEINFCPPRQGDIASLVADIEKAKKELNFTVKFKNIEQIIKTSWEWHKWLYNHKRA